MKTGTFTMKRGLFFGVMIICLGMIVPGCSRNESAPKESKGTGSVTFSIQWPQRAMTQQSNIPPLVAAIDDNECAKLTVEATMNDAQDNLLASGGPWPCSDRKGTIDNIPEGSDRKIVVTAKDSVGFVVYRGESAGIRIIAGQNTKIGVIAVQPVTFQLLVGGSGDDEAISIQPMSDGGYMVVGKSDSTNIPEQINHGGYDGYILKLNATGDVLWQRLIGGSGDDFPETCQPTNDGGYIISGNTTSADIPGYPYHGGKNDGFIYKLTANGDVRWLRLVGGSGDDQLISSQPTSDGGYMVVGGSSSTDIFGQSNHGNYDGYILKLNANGVVLWERLVGGSNVDFAISIQPTSDGGYMVVGYSGSTDIPEQTNHGSNDVYILKLNANGVVLWERLVGGSGFDFPYSIRQTDDGGYMVVGYSNSTDIPGQTYHGGEWDVYILKLNADGDVLWQRLVGGSGFDQAASCQPTSDGGYIVLGWTESTDIPGQTNHGSFDGYIIKLNADGDVLWQRLVGGLGFDIACWSTPMNGGGWMVVGWSSSLDIPGQTYHGGSGDVYILRLNANGEP
jgi:uncharacterized delta-60 repeat protein